MSRYRIDGDHWMGQRNEAWCIDDPTVFDLQNAIRMLDASKRTIVTIQAAGEEHMAIGGGGGKYVVYATFDNDEFWNLIGNDPSEGVVLLNAGGQEGDYPANQIVSLQQALAAGERFLCFGDLNAAQSWRRQ